MLVVRLLGGLTVTDDTAPVAAPRGRCAALLAWLALHPGMQPRGRVAARLWPDVMDESARRSLRTALLDLRAELGPLAAGTCSRRATRSGSDPTSASTSAISSTRPPTDAWRRRWRSAAPASSCPSSTTSGCIEAREEHELRLAEVIEQLAIEAEERGDPGGAVEYTRRLVALDPLSEEHARSLMRRLALAEDRAAALSAFEQHRERLRSELRMVPSAATRALADEIRDGGDRRRRRGRGSPEVGRPSLPGAAGPGGGCGPARRPRGRARRPRGGVGRRRGRPPAPMPDHRRGRDRQEPPHRRAGTAGRGRRRTGALRRLSREPAPSVRAVRRRDLPRPPRARPSRRRAPARHERRRARAHHPGSPRPLRRGGARLRREPGRRADAAVRRCGRLPPAHGAAARAPRDRGHPLGGVGHARAAGSRRPDRLLARSCSWSAAGTSPRT